MKTIKLGKITILSTVARALGAILLLALSAMAAGEKSKLNTADARFIQEEASAGVALVQMAELGEQKAQREEIKAFAGMLVADHTKANAELAALAASKGVDLSTQPGAKHAKHRDMQDKLERTSGGGFDKEFLSMIVSGHEKCVKNFKQASKGAADRDVKEWAAKMLPGLQSHLGKAEELSSGSTGKEGVTTTTPGTRPHSARNMRDRDLNPTQADNAARNMRDRDREFLTPLDQGNSKADIDRTAKIRREITGKKGLSVNAQNVKIVTHEGRVTLRGPVDSADEKRIIGEIATRIATPEHTDNQLEVRSASAGN